MVNDKDSCLEMAEALDGMTRRLSSDNTDFLDQVLKTLRAGKPLKEKDKKKLEALYERYFRQTDAENEDEESDEDEEKQPTDEVDDDDFV